MKILATFAALLLTLATQAQNCISNQNVMYQEWFDHYGGIVRDDGGVISLLLPDMPTAVFTTRWAPDAAVLWNRYVQHVDPNNHMHAESITDPYGPGALVTGEFLHSSNGEIRYKNLFGLELDADGEPVWARFYMQDSVEQMGNSEPAMYKHPDGGYVFLSNTNYGVSVSKLNSNAVPVWTKRYRIGELTWGGNVFVEDNGELTITCYKSYRCSIIRTDANGVPIWKRTYASPELGGVALRTIDGEYMATGANFQTSVAYLSRLDHDGHVLWRRSYPDPAQVGVRGITQMANGNVFAYTSDGIREVEPDGTLINSWEDDPLQAGPRFMGSSEPHGDSLFMGSSDYSLGFPAPRVTISAGTGCYTPVANASSVLANPAEITDDTLYVVEDSLKTWTMNIGQSQNTNAFDPKAYLSAGPARPGFQHYAYAVITNNSLNTTTSPITATLTYSPQINYLEAIPAPSLLSGQTITWQLPAMGPHTQMFIHTLFETPPDPGLLGTVLNYTFSFTQDTTELSLANNTATKTSVVVGSFDPNTKEVLPRDFYHIENDSILDYTIHFQNTGTAAAETVVIRDTLPLDVDSRTFQLGARSHACTYSLTGDGILTFTFNDINLPDSNANEPASHGLVNFTIKPILPLTLGQEITNAADIHFDFNPPIHTPDATVIVTDETAARPVAAGDQLAVFPVPVKGMLTAVLPPGFPISDAWATGVDGRRIALRTSKLEEGRAQFSVERLAAGAYVLTLMDDQGHRLSARFTKD